MERPSGSTRSEPRISVAKLGEYLDASVRRREAIIKDQMDPPTYIVIRYTNARNAIQAALVANKDVVRRLGELADTIEVMVPKNSQEADSLRLNAEAVRRFANIFPTLALKGTTPLLVSPKGFSFRTEGVQISVAPVVLLRRERKGVEYWGAMLGVFRKTEALGVRGGKAVAELIRIALTKAGYTNIRADMCVAVDVFAGQIFTASGSGARVADEICAACREIAARWDTAA